MLAFLCGSQVYAQKEQNEDMSILFVGNSYTHMNDMPAIFDKICKSKGKSVYVEKNTRSGSSFNIHTTRPDLFEAINSRVWDVVILQGYSREMSFPPEYIDTATIPYIKQIIDSIRAKDSCTRILLHMTWGYKEGYEEREDIDTYDKMTEQIALGYKYLSDTLDLPIVPVGKVWQEVRTKYPEIELYDADKAHPSKNGSYVSACTFYTSIFKESPEGAVTSTISSLISPNIQKTAADYVLQNYDAYKLSKDFYKIEWKMNKEGSFLLTGVANFDKAKDITWNFDDGSTSKDKKVTHKYSKPGNYKVILTVDNECGVKEIVRNVKLTAPKPPTTKPTVKPKKGNTPKKKS